MTDVIKEVEALRDSIREHSGGHALTNADGDYLWYTTHPVNLTKLAAILRKQQAVKVSLEKCKKALASWAWYECQPTGEHFCFIDDNAGEIAKAVLDSLKQQGVEVEYE